MEVAVHSYFVKTSVLENTAESPISQREELEKPHKKTDLIY